MLAKTLSWFCILFVLFALLLATCHAIATQNTEFILRAQYYAHRESGSWEQWLDAFKIGAIKIDSFIMNIIS